MASLLSEYKQMGMLPRRRIQKASFWSRYVGRESSAVSVAADVFLDPLYATNGETVPTEVTNITAVSDNISCRSSCSFDHVAPLESVILQTTMTAAAAN